MIPAPESAAEAALTKATWQAEIFAERLRRSRLIRLKPSWPRRSFNAQVHRNQPFELIANSMNPFLNFAECDVQFQYTDYDDSLAFADIGDVDLHIVSLDYSRYANSFDVDDLVSWIAGRVTHLRSLTNAPILLTNADEDFDGFNALLDKHISIIPFTFVCDNSAVASELGADFRDDRSIDIKASSWSDLALLHIARAFGLQWIPAVLFEPIKAIALDLDNTIIGGVLGEDGVEGIEISESFLMLQRTITRLHDRGLFIALVSRNELEDVEELFEQRHDMVLKRSMFSVFSVNWNSKALNIERVADDLHIGTDAILFVDDNAGELAAVAAELTGIRTAHAADPETTSRILEQYPGLFRFAGNHEDHIRATDIAATQARQLAISNAGDTTEYLASLAIQLEFRIDDRANVRRMHELTNKTNQFNTALARTNEATIAQALDSGTLRAVTVALRDRLSDSGTIGLLLGWVDDDTVIVEELAISCRALGRSLEDALIFHAVQLLKDGVAPRQVTFRWNEGPRNTPALEWLRRWTPELGKDGNAIVEWRSDDIEQAMQKTPATLTTEVPND